MSNKVKIVFKRTKQNKQITEAFIDGVVIGRIIGNRKPGAGRPLLSMSHYDVDLVHVSDCQYWTSGYEYAKDMIRTTMASHLNKEVV